MWQPRCVFSPVTRPATSPGTCSTSTAECICERAAHLIENIWGRSIDDRSVRPPTRGHARTDKTLGNTNEWNSAGGRDMTGGRVIANKQFGPCDLGRKRSEGTLMSSHSGCECAFNASAFLVGAAFIN